MKSFLLKNILSILLSFFSFYSFAQVKVKGYYRSNGTYVQPHVRSSPDSNPFNNYSYPGNYNPYTGKTATGNESTYLDNYYNRSSNYNSGNSSQANSNNTYLKTRSVKPDKFSVDTNGNYGIQYSSEVGVTKYYLYSSNQTKYGKVYFFDDGDMCIYDLSNNLIKRSRNTYLDSYNSGGSNQEVPQYYSYNSQGAINKIETVNSNKIDFGIYGHYIVEYSKESNVTKYYVYDSKNVRYGKIYFFEDGDMCFYDLFNNLIKKIRYK